MSILLTEKELETKVKALSPAQILYYESCLQETSQAWKDFVCEAQLKKIALKLQAIYNIADLKISDRQMGEFIQKLMEEVK